MEKIMKILVIGATGPTGRELVTQGIALDHEITAVVRRPELASLPKEVRLLRGDVTDAASMAAAVAGQDAVISSLGTKLSRKPTTLLSEGTRNLVAAMNEAGVRRLVCITGMGAGDSKGHGGFLYDGIILPLLLKEIYKDKDRQEALIRESSLDWSIVRPGMLTDGPRTGQFRPLFDLTGISGGKISRADVATFILAHIKDRASYGQTINLIY
jgi:putative NADH-flavin reductase